MNKPLSLVFLFLLSAASAQPPAEQEFSSVSGVLSDALAQGARETTTVGPSCWRRNADPLADQLDVPVRVCVRSFDLLTTKTEAAIIIEGTPI
ncbi:MAG: hypothetical protein ACHQ49_02060 [Elusimicrobiota bacterium]